MLDFFYHLFGNFGVAILIVTVILKIFFFPLANKSYASMAKMKAVQPEMTSIRERYEDDKVQAAAGADGALQEGEDQSGRRLLAGADPDPGLLRALQGAVRHDRDASRAVLRLDPRSRGAGSDSVFNLFGLLPYNPGAVPVIGHFLMLGAWPLIMGITMWLQMKMNPEPPDPVQKQVFAWMPVIFTFMLGSFPAGLVIYWAWNNLLSVTQQGFIMRRNGVKIELWDNLRRCSEKSPRKG